MSQIFLFYNNCYKSLQLNWNIFNSRVILYITGGLQKMAEQETLIYIEENDELDAGILAKSFAKDNIRNRAYINALGAQLAKKYLTSENVDISNTYNLHSIHKILEELDIADIMLKNIHIDVRVIFNEEYIFIPKSHFNLEILPDIYLVLSLSQDHKYMKFLGFFEPKLINKNNQNEDYYFIEKEKLTSPFNLRDYISNFKGNTAQSLSEDVIENSDMLMVSLIDHDINEKDKKELLKNLKKSAHLRDRFIEFENFELLAYKAEHSPDVIKPAAEGLDAGFANMNKIENFVSDTTEDIMPDETLDLENLADEFTTGIAEAAPAIEAGAVDAMIDGLDSLEDLGENITEVTDDNAGEAELTNENEVFDFAGDIEDIGDVVEENSTESIEPTQEDILNIDSFKDNAIENLETKDTPIDMSIETGLAEGEVSAFEAQEAIENNIEEINTDDIDALTFGNNQEENISVSDVKDEATLQAQERENNFEITEETASDDLNFSPTDELVMEEDLDIDNLNIDDIELSQGLNMDAEMEPEPKKEQVKYERPSEETVDFDSISQVSDEVKSSGAAIQEETVNFDDFEISEDPSETGDLICEPEIQEPVSANTVDIADLDLEAEDLGSAPVNHSEDAIDVNDFKNIGVDAEELPPSTSQISSKDLISQIDDLLSEEDNEQNEILQNEVIEEEALSDESDIDALDAEPSETQQNDDDDDKLEMLFNSGELHESVDSLNDAEMNETELESENQPAIYQKVMKLNEKGKKGLIVAAALVAVIAAAVGTGMFLKNKNAGAPSDAVSQNAPDELPQTPVPEDNSQDIPDNTSLMTNAPELDKLPAAKTEKPANNKELKNTAPKSKPAAAANSYVTVTKVMWEVPDYLSYSDKVKQYLQSAGKSIKLSLSSDLLLATEYAYSNQVKVDLKLKNDGTLVAAQIAKSSGSNEINDIVLQTVKSTLNVVKPAPGEIPTADFNLGLIIYF